MRNQVFSSLTQSLIVIIIQKKYFLPPILSMTYWKNHQQTLSTQYQDISFAKHTPLKSSNINSCSILNETNLNAHLRNSSVESIKSPTKSRYASVNNCFQNETICSHISRSQFYLKDIILDDEIKQNAYLFFNQQKNKILSVRRSHQYLLPKICVKSKKAYQSINAQSCTYNENELKCSKQPGKQKVQKGSIFKKCKLNISDVRKELNDEENATGVTEKFRQRCEAELEKISLKIPEHFSRETCFFDLTQQQIQHLYSNPQPVKEPQQITTNQPHSESDKRQKKFKLMRIDSDSREVEENKSVPLFLMKRLSAKDLFRSSDNSFLTDVPRIQNSLAKRPTRLRHIL